MKPISHRVHQLASNRANLAGSFQYRLELGEALKALDEWQASVEERLTSIGLGAGPGFRPVPPVTVRFEEEKPPAVRIDDPGPGKYDREPEDLPE